MARPHISPNQREILYVTDSITGNATYVTATNNKLDVNATASLAGSALPISSATTAVGVAIVDGSGNQISSFSNEKASTSTIARVATSTTSATVLASNSARKKAVVVNDAAANLYVKYGVTASSSSFSYLLQPGDTLEENVYTGRIDAILASGTGNAEVNEL